MNLPAPDTFLNLNTGEVFLIVFSLVFVIWLIYTFVAVYHWVHFGHHSPIGVPALVTHVLVSSLLFLIAGSGFFFT